MRDAIKALRSLHVRATSLWRGFDERCRVEVKVDTGRVVCGQFGPPGDESLDVYGDSLNQLFELASGQFMVTPEVEALLKDNPRKQPPGS